MTLARHRLDADCRMRLLPGFDVDSTQWVVSLPQFGVQNIHGNFTMVDEVLNNRCALCRVTVGHREDSSTSQSLLVALATEMGYLNTTKRVLLDKHNLTLWHAFASKALYAERHQLTFLIWIGKFDGDDETRAPWCDKDSPRSLHAYKALAARVSLAKHPSAKAVAYLDADAVVADGTLLPTDYLDVAGPHADLVGTSDSYSSRGKPFVLLNSGVWILRNSRWARGFLQLWWNNRCGKWDQLAMWRTLFDLWRLDVPAFTYDADELFRSWETCKSRALKTIVEQFDIFEQHRQHLNLRNARRRITTSYGSAAAVFKATACLLQPLHLPHVVLLPTVPFLDEKDHPVLPLQHYHAHVQFACHLDQRRRLLASTANNDVSNSTMRDEATDFYCTPKAARFAATKHVGARDNTLCTPKAKSLCAATSDGDGDEDSANSSTTSSVLSAVQDGSQLWWLASCNRSSMSSQPGIDISNQGRWCGKCHDLPRKILRSLCSAPAHEKNTPFFRDLHSLVLHPACHAHVHRVLDDEEEEASRRRRRQRRQQKKEI